MATYAVGDIQGCLDQLKHLLEHVKFSSTDVLWLAGDLVNRGPKSLETLRFVQNLGKQAIVVLGNHDLHLLACYFGTRTPNKKDTFDDILVAEDKDELMRWLIHQPLLHHDPSLGYTMVHAGIPPNWSLATAQVRANEVERVLRSHNPKDYFDNMYGNDPAGWRDDLQGPTRMRVITNYFTRMRFCSAQGELEFESKCSPDQPPPGYLPWYAHSDHKCIDKPIIFGHWAAMLGQTQSDNFIGLDTGCVWGGQLTMMRLDDTSRFCIDCTL